MNEQCYSDSELEAFRQLINKKLDKAKRELSTTLNMLENTNSGIARDKVHGLEDSPSVEEQENLNFLSIRLKKFITHLESALVRIKNKTYGICRETGKRISKERLLLVPHATLSVEAKKKRKLEN